jgi:hypothetical protein
MAPECTRSIHYVDRVLEDVVATFKREPSLAGRRRKERSKVSLAPLGLLSCLGFAALLFLDGCF